MKGWGRQHEDSNSKPRINHNYLFTSEIHSSFVYKGTEVFSFCGDDDVWVYIDNILVMDMGGLHARFCCTVTLNQMVNKTITGGAPCVDGLGNVNLQINHKYDFVMFHAERACCGSNFEFDTTLVLDTQASVPEGTPIDNVIGDPVCTCNATSHGHCVSESEMCVCDSSSTLGYWSGPQCTTCMNGYTGSDCKTVSGATIQKARVYYENFYTDGLGKRFRYASNQMFDVTMNVDGSAAFGTGEYLMAVNLKRNREETGNKLHFYRPLEPIDVTAFNSVEICAKFAANQGGLFRVNDFIEIAIDWDWTGGQFEDDQRVAKWVTKSPSMALETTNAYQLAAALSTNYCFPVNVPELARTMGVTVYFFNAGSDTLVAMDDFTVNGWVAQSRYQYLIANANTDIVFPRASPYSLSYSDFKMKGGCANGRFTFAIELNIAAPISNMVLFKHGDTADSNAPAVYIDSSLHVVVVVGDDIVTSRSTVTASEWTPIVVAYHAPYLYIMINDELDTKTHAIAPQNTGGFYVGAHPLEPVGLVGTARNIKWSCMEALVPHKFMRESDTEKIVIFSTNAYSKLSGSLTVSPSSLLLLGTAQTVKFTLTVTNVGPDNEPNVRVSFTTTDYTQAGSQVYAIAKSSGTHLIETDKTKISWNTSIASGASATMNVSFDIVGFEDFSLSVISMSAEMTGDLYWGPPQTVTKSLTLQRNANLGVTIPIDGKLPSVVLSGDVVTLKNVITNGAGSSIAYNPEVTNTFPVGWSYVSYAVSGLGVAARCSGLANTVTCSVPKIAANQQSIITITARVGPSTRGVYVHNSTLNPGTKIDDTTPDNNIASCTTEIRTNATLRIVSIGASDSVMASKQTPEGRLNIQYLDYTVTLRNDGPADVEYADFYMDQTELPLVASEVTKDPEWTCDNDTRLIHCVIPYFAASTIKLLQLRAPIEFASGGDTIVNTTVSVTWYSNVSGIVNAVNTSSFTYRAKADIVAGVMATTSVVLINATTPITAIARSMGPVSADGVTLEVFVPVNVDFTDTSDAACTSEDYTAGSPLGTPTSKKILCTIGSLDVGQNYNMTFAVGITPYTASSVFIIARTYTSVSDITPDNNIAKIEIKVSTSTDLKLAKIMPSSTTVFTGQTFGLALVALNGGLNSAKDVRIKLKVPASVLYINAIAQPAAMCNYTFGVVDCIYAAPVLPKNLVKLSVLLKLPSSAPLSSLPFVATAHMFNVDDVPADNTESVELDVAQQADLSVTMTSSPRVAVVGDVILGTIFLQNSGFSDISDMILNVTYPGNATLVETGTSIPTKLKYSSFMYNGMRQIKIELNAAETFRADETLMIVLVVRSDPALVGVDQKTIASVGSFTTDPNYNNNVFTVNTTLTAPHTSFAVNFAGVGYGYVGQGYSLVVQLSSAGPSYAENVVVVMEVHPELNWTLSEECVLNTERDRIICTIAYMDKTLPQGDDLNAPVLLDVVGTIPTSSSLRTFSISVLSVDCSIDSEFTPRSFGPIPIYYYNDVAIDSFKSRSVSPLTTFSTLTQTIVVTNAVRHNDPENPHGLLWSDLEPVLNITLDPNVVFDHVEMIDTACVSCVCEYTPSTHKLGCLFRSLSAGETSEMMLYTIVAPNVNYDSGVITTTAVVSARDANAIDKNMTNNAASMTYSVISALIDIEMTMFPGNVSVSDSFASIATEISVTHSNASGLVNSRSRNNVLVVTFPEFMHAANLSTCNFDDVECKCQYNNDTRVMTCNLKDMSVSEAENLEVRIIIDTDKAIVANVYDLMFNATVTSSMQDVNSANNVAHVNVTVEKRNFGEKLVEVTDDSIVLWQLIAGVGLLAGFIGGLTRTSFFKRAKHDVLIAQHEKEMEDIDAMLADTDNQMRPATTEDLALDQDVDMDADGVWKVADVSGVQTK